MTENNEIKNIEIDKIKPSAFQPRESFDKAKIEELAASIKERGLINPLTVRKTDNGYEIIAGERRWRACSLLGWTHMSCIIRDVTEEQQRIDSLIENIHREDLNVIEKGRGVLEVFRAHGINDNPKVIANEIHRQREVKRKKNMPPDGINYLKICKDIAVAPRTIMLWLEAIAVDQTILNKEVQKTDPIATQTLSRLSTIKDKKVQKKTYDTIVEQELNKQKASKFISKSNELPDVDHSILIQELEVSEEDESLALEKEVLQTLTEVAEPEQQTELYETFRSQQLSKEEAEEFITEYKKAPNLSHEVLLQEIQKPSEERMNPLTMEDLSALSDTEQIKLYEQARKLQPSDTEYISNRATESEEEREKHLKVKEVVTHFNTVADGEDVINKYNENIDGQLERRQVQSAYMTLIDQERENHYYSWVYLSHLSNFIRVVHCPVCGAKSFNCTHFSLKLLDELISQSKTNFIESGTRETADLRYVKVKKAKAEETTDDEEDYDLEDDDKE